MLIYKEAINNNKKFIVIKSLPKNSITIIIIVDEKYKIKTDFKKNRLLLNFRKTTIIIDILKSKKNRYFWKINANYIQNDNWSLRVGPWYQKNKIMNKPILTIEKKNHKISIENFTIIRNNNPIKLDYDFISNLTMIVDDEFYQNHQYLEIQKNKKLYKFQFIYNSGVVYFK